jgi:uncharacterized protein YjiS (DUF1127 family)
MNTTRSGTATISDRLNSVLQSVRAAFARRRLYNQTVRELANLSDRDLSDLGIHRSSISEIAFEAAYGK